MHRLAAITLSMRLVHVRNQRHIYMHRLAAITVSMRLVHVRNQRHIYMHRLAAITLSMRLVHKNTQDKYTHSSPRSNHSDYTSCSCAQQEAHAS